MPSASFYNVASWSWCAHAVFRRARQHLEKYPWLTQCLPLRGSAPEKIPVMPSVMPVGQFIRFWPTLNSSARAGSGYSAVN